MNRAERRRLEKEARDKAKPKTYTLTAEQLHNAVKDGMHHELQRVRKEATEEAVGVAITLLLNLPVKVLKEHYWRKTYKRKLPKFTEQVLDLYKKWQQGELDIDELRAEIQEDTGITIEEAYE